MNVPKKIKQLPFLILIVLSLLLCSSGIQYTEPESELKIDTRRMYNISYNYTGIEKEEVIPVKVESVEEDNTHLFTYTKEFPKTITVRVTGKLECTEETWYRLKELELKQYVKHVLATEWGHDWNEESLKAGAVAVKMYALYAIKNAGEWIDTEVYFKGEWQPARILSGGKWIDAHVYDCNYDMAYNPKLEFESTNRAVDETWDYVLVGKDGEIFETHFVAWFNACSTFTEDGTCMGQWNSKADADKGMSWKGILEKYYPASQLVKWGEPIELDNKPSEHTKEYTIKQGDTISSIAKRFYDSVDTRYWNLILRENSLTSTSVLSIGRVLRIPEDLQELEYVVSQQNLEGYQDSGINLPKIQFVEENLNEYVVQRGDTLSGISKAFYGVVDVQKIYEANLNILRSVDLINVGMILYIPPQ